MHSHMNDTDEMTKERRRKRRRRNEKKGERERDGNQSNLSRELEL